MVLRLTQVEVFVIVNKLIVSKNMGRGEHAPCVTY